MITFATLGPGGTNHELVTRRYIDFHGIKDAKIEPIGDFDIAAQWLIDGKVDYIIQCAVHPDTPRTLGNHFRSFYVVDTFISPSKDLAILTRSEVDHPASIAAILPATEGYADLSRWQSKHHEYSIPVILEKLLTGEYDSGLVYLEYAEKYPGRFRIDEVIGSPDDAWIVYGRERTYRDRVLACLESPVSKQFRALEMRTV